MTAEEIEHLLLHGDAGGYGTERTLHTTLCAQAIAALVAERTAAAVAAARAEERAACARVADDSYHDEAYGNWVASAPAPATPAARPGGGGEADEEWIYALLRSRQWEPSVIEALRLPADAVRQRECWDAARAIADHLTPRPDPLPQAGCTCLACEQLRDYQRRGVASAFRRRDAREALVAEVVAAGEEFLDASEPFPGTRAGEARRRLRAALDALGKEG